MDSLDLPETTVERKEIIEEKKYLKSVYEHFYKIFVENSNGTPKGKKIELGSGAGFLKFFIPDVITSDVIKLPFCDMRFAAEHIPFKNGELSCIYMLNTMHHIKDPLKALTEFERSLKKGGKVIMVEPANTAFSRFIYKNFHHEDFNENAGWKIEKKGDLSSSNQAAAFILFKRDKRLFNKKFPNLKVIKYENHTPFNYIISGGFTRRSLLPSFAFKIIEKIEEFLKPLNSYLGLFTTVVLKKV